MVTVRVLPRAIVPSSTVGMSFLELSYFQDGTRQGDALQGTPYAGLLPTTADGIVQLRQTI